ncbi:MAG: SDR family oxidoreductase [Bdellovibrionaceae bacterium]|nr:SDR family oxidoreductase [Bdellovibrio sp.]
MPIKKKDNQINNNPVCLITGASKGLGLGLIKQFAQNGYTVIGCGRSKLDEETTRTLNSLNSKPIYLQCDITKSDDVETLFKNIEHQFGKIDVVINNAGGAEKFGSFLELSEEDWKNSLELNLISVVRITKRAIPLLKKSTRARIINICSTSAIMPGYFNPHYSAAKAGMLNLNKHLSNVLAEDNILVNAINLGPTKTDSWKKNTENLAQVNNTTVEMADQLLTDQEKAKIPLKCLGNTDDVGHLALFLAQETTTWLTGASINLDGGKYRGL